MRFIRAAAPVVAGAAIVIMLQPEREASPPLTGLVDHHVHLLGPDVMRDWRALGVTFSRPDSVYASPDALLALPADSIASVVLVPMAHLYANPEFAGELGLDAAEVRRRVRRENMHVSGAAARHPSRAVALCSVPVLAEWALAELAWCRDSLHVAGVKLHLASSQVDLRDTTHLDALRTLVGTAAAHQLPVLLHLDPQRRGHDATHIRAFAERVLKPFPELILVVAHLGGSGGYGPWTRTVFRTLQDWCREVEGGGPRRSIYFELSAVVLEAPSEGVPATTPVELELLRTDLRAGSLDQIVFGSDYPVFEPHRSSEVLVRRLGLSDLEARRILRGVPGGIFRARSSP